MWFKKKVYISGYNSNTAVDGTDWRTTYKNQSWSTSQTLPSAADANKYFYLPALGYYFFGQLYILGDKGEYWSSSANPGGGDKAYFMQFYSGNVWVGGFHSNNREHGMRVGVFE